MKIQRALTIAAAITVCALPLQAQVRPVSAGGSDPSAVLKLTLRQLVVAQENYWNGHGTYTTDVAALGMYPPKGGGDSVWVQVVQAGGRSWWGRAVHRGRKDLSCAIYIGLTEDFTSAPMTDANKTKAQKEGEPICDAF